MRKIILFLLPLCVLYFLVGAILMWTKVLDQQTYLSGAGIVGAIASVLALLSFLRPPLTRTDIQNIEAESLQKLGEVSSEIKKLEEARSKTAVQISDLETQKKEMEFLVRKASMSLFLKEQYSRHEQAVTDHLNGHPQVLKSLEEISSLRKKLDVLDEEIESDPNVEMLKSIIDSASIRRTPLDIMIDNVRSPFLKFILRALRTYAIGFNRAFRLK